MYALILLVTIGQVPEIVVRVPMPAPSTIVQQAPVATMAPDPGTAAAAAPLVTGGCYGSTANGASAYSAAAPLVTGGGCYSSSSAAASAYGSVVQAPVLMLGTAAMLSAATPVLSLPGLSAAPTAGRTRIRYRYRSHGLFGRPLYP